MDGWRRWGMCSPSAHAALPRPALNTIDGKVPCPWTDARRQICLSQLLGTGAFRDCLPGWHSSALQCLRAQDGGPARGQAQGRAGGPEEAAQWSVPLTWNLGHGLWKRSKADLERDLEKGSIISLVLHLFSVWLLLRCSPRKKSREWAVEGACPQRLVVGISFLMEWEDRGREAAVHGVLRVWRKITGRSLQPANLLSCALAALYIPHLWVAVRTYSCALSSPAPQPLCPLLLQGAHWAPKPLCWRRSEWCMG